MLGLGFLARIVKPVIYRPIQGGPEKKHGTGYFPQYVDAITGISV